MARGIRSTRREVPMAKTLVTYNVDVGESYQEKVSYKKTVLSPTTFTPTKSGYSFLGWKLTGIASSDVLVECIAQGKTMTLYAVFQKNITVTKYNASNTPSYDPKKQYYNNSDILNPTFTLNETAIGGWSNAGWTTNAGGYSKTVDDGGQVTLSADTTYYSLYNQTITVTYYNNSNSASTKTGTRVANIHNTTTYSDPTFNLTVASVSGWSIRGWSTSSSSNASITYNSGANFTRNNNVTLYASWNKTITVTYYNNSNSASSTSGTAYRSYNGTESNPTFNLTVAGVSGWSVRGWSTSSRSSAAITYASGTNFTRSRNITLYASWNKTVTVTYYNNSASASSTSGTAYRSYNGTESGASFTLTQSGKSGWSARGWTTSSSGGSSAITYNNGATFTRTSNITLYGCYYRTVTATFNGNGATSGSTGNVTGTAYYHSTSGYTSAAMTFPSSGYGKSNYSFVHWNQSSDNTGASYDPGYTLYTTTDYTYYAIWSRNSSRKDFNQAINLGERDSSLHTSSMVVDCTDYKYADIYCKLNVWGQWNNTTAWVENRCYVGVGDGSHLVYRGTAKKEAYDGNDYPTEVLDAGPSIVTVDVSSLSGNKNIVAKCGLGDFAGGITGEMLIYYVNMHN